MEIVKEDGKFFEIVKREIEVEPITDEINHCKNQIIKLEAMLAEINKL